MGNYRTYNKNIEADMNFIETDTNFIEADIFEENIS